MGFTKSHEKTCFTCASAPDKFQLFAIYSYSDRNNGYAS